MFDIITRIRIWLVAVALALVASLGAIRASSSCALPMIPNGLTPMK